MSVSRKRVYVKVSGVTYEVLEDPSIKAVDLFPKVHEGLRLFCAAISHSVKYRENIFREDDVPDVGINFFNIGESVFMLGQIVDLFEEHEIQNMLKYVFLNGRSIYMRESEVFSDDFVSYVKLLIAVLDVNYRYVLTEGDQYQMRFPDHSSEAEEASQLMQSSGVNYLYQRIASKRKASLFEMENEWSIQGIMETHRALDVEADVSALISKRLEQKSK